MMVRQPDSPYVNRPEKIGAVIDGNHKVTVQPTLEPITLVEGKKHLRVDHALDDDLINTLIKASRETCEKWQSRAYLQQTQTFSLNFIPGQFREIWLPVLPIISVDSIVITQKGVADITIPSDQYDVDLIGGRVTLNSDYASTHDSSLLPVYNQFTITFKAGYGDVASAVPERIKQPIKLTLGHWYENREATSDGREVKEIPLGAKMLLDMERVF